MHYEGELFQCGFPDKEFDMSAHQGRWDMVDRIGHSRRCFSEYLLNLLTGPHIATQHLDCQLCRGLVEQLEGALGDALLRRHYRQDTLDVWHDLLQNLEPLA
jgi:hypothetical protein